MSNFGLCYPGIWAVDLMFYDQVGKQLSDGLCISVVAVQQVCYFIGHCFGDGSLTFAATQKLRIVFSFVIWEMSANAAG